jgi:hypothetical protein
VPQTQNNTLPPLQHVWIGYLLAIATTFADVVSVDQQPDLSAGQLCRRFMFSCQVLWE